MFIFEKRERESPYISTLFSEDNQSYPKTRGFALAFLSGIAKGFFPLRKMESFWRVGEGLSRNEDRGYERGLGDVFRWICGLFYMLVRIMTRGRGLDLRMGWG